MKLRGNFVLSFYSMSARFCLLVFRRNNKIFVQYKFKSDNFLFTSDMVVFISDMFWPSFPLKVTRFAQEGQFFGPGVTRFSFTRLW